MSEMWKEFTMFSERLENFIVAYSKKTNPTNIKFDSTILRRSKKPNHGDFSVAAVMVERLKIKDSKAFSEALFQGSADWPLPIDSCSITDQGALCFKLRRPSVFKKVLTTVLQERDNYGTFGAGRLEGSVGVGIVTNCPPRTQRETEERGRREEDDEDLTLSQLRGLLLTEHLSSLLETTGFQVCQVTPITCAPLKTLDCFGIRTLQTHENEVSSSQSERETQERLVHVASCSRFRTDWPGSGGQEDMTLGQRLSEDDVTGQASQAWSDSAGVVPRTVDSIMNVHLDLHHYITDEKLPLGKSGYDKNLQRVKVVLDNGSLSPVLAQCCRIEEGLKGIHPLPSHLVHVASQATSFQQQQVDLVWRLCTTPAKSKALRQRHLTHGPVTARRVGSEGREDISAAELFKLREAQTRQASFLKYGEEVQGEAWEELIKRLTVAGLKFEILGKQCHHPLKLELSDSRKSSTWPDSRDGVFVMYNYARLCTLFRHFEEEVAKGTYPPLPEVSSLDFSLLREEQEWGLLFNYVLQYPVMLAECVDDMLEGKGPHVNIQTHRVCSFLVSLCRDLSSYYSHTHVLGEPRPHLVATMFARLGLLKGVQQIIKNGLSLLNIEPLTQM